MKKLLIAVVVLTMVVALGNVSNAQSKMALGVGADVLLPIGTFGDGQGIGFGGSVRGQYDITPMFSAGLTVGYYIWTGKDFSQGGFSIKGESFKGLPVRVFGKYYFMPVEEKVRVYGIAELGLFFVSRADKTIPNPAAGLPGQPANITQPGGTSSDFNYAPGVGAEFALGSGPMKLDVSARYDGIATSGQSIGSIAARVGVIFPIGN